MRALLVIPVAGCTTVLGITDPKPAGDGGPDVMVDSHIDAPPPCTTSIALGAEVTTELGKTGTGFGIGRFNNGLDEDIVVAAGADAVILFGNRTGAFANPTTIATAAADVAIDDFDLVTSADDDFAFYTPGGTTVTIHRQNRANNPPVEAAQPITGLGNVQRVVGEQLENGNGQPDLLVYDATVGTRTYFSSVGSPGTFTAGPIVGVAGDELILTRQIDGMSRADALLVNGDQVKVAIATGTSGFASPSLAATGAASKGVALGRFDGDNLVDLVVSTAGGLVLFRQVAAAPGTFQMHGVISPLQSATPMLVGDLNDDGRDDLILPNVAILQCAPPAAGMPGVFTQVEAISAAPPAKLVDISGDGKPDLVRLEGTSIKVRLR